MKPTRPCSRQTWGYPGATSCGPAVRDWLSGCSRLACLDLPSSKVGGGEPGMHPGRWPGGAMSLLFVPQVGSSVEAMGPK
jgi:hypothetical protein